jgi:hypothetical protein
MSVLFKQSASLRTASLALGRFVRSLDVVRSGIVVAFVAVTILSFVAHSGDQVGFIVDFVFVTIACGISLLVFHEQRPF